MTGELESPACFGEGKAVWAERFAAEHGVDLDRSYFYTDSLSDLPLLERVGHPVAVNPDPRLRRLALRRVADGQVLLKCGIIGSPAPIRLLVRTKLERLAVLHRHLVHQQFTLAAIDDIIARGKRQDWAELRRAALNDRAIMEKVLRVCQAHVADPYAQRYHFWKHYAERYLS